MKNNIYFLFTLLFCCLYHSNSFAQKWQWGITQGSSSNTDRVEDMATDIYGNIYLVSRVGKNDPFAASMSLPNGKGLGDRHTMLVSYDCKGNYRWSKVIGANTARTLSLRVTQGGHVYLFGLVAAGTGYSIYYDNDTATPATSYQQRMSLICYDTLGNFKWLRRPDSVATTIYEYHPMSMDIDEFGNAYCLVSMPPSSKILGSRLTIPSTAPFKGLGAYVLKYNPSGSLLSVTMLKDFSYINGASSITPGATLLSHNKFNNGYLISTLNYPTAGDSLYIKGAFVKNNVFFGSFLSDGTLKWHFTDTATSNGTNYLFAAKTDDTGNILLGGSLGHKNLFNGFYFNNPFCSNRTVGMPFIMKMDSNGLRKWVAVGGSDESCSNNTTFGISINKKYAVISGIGWQKKYFGNPYIDTVIINHYKPGGPGQDGWYAVVDIKTGKTVKLATARGDGFYDGITGLHFNGDDLYLAGHTESDSIIIDSTFAVKKNPGTAIDVFMAKYSFNCGCIGTPVATYSYNSGTNNFTFTGTTPADSVTWDFGDGSTGKGLTVHHGYANKGKYKVCATLWSPTCGPVFYCDSIGVTLSIPTALAYRNLLIYPNPTKDNIHIEGLPEGSEISVFSMVGQKLKNKKATSIKEQIDLSQIASGMYLLQIKDAAGNVYSTKIVKE